jgi:hypothetical protein
MSGNVVMARNAEGPGAEYSTKNMQGKKKKATFECQSCTRKFATRSHLVRHSRVHTGERRYACDYPGCEMRCSRKDNLQQQYVYFISSPFLAFSVHWTPLTTVPRAYGDMSIDLSPPVTGPISSSIQDAQMRNQSSPVHLTSLSQKAPPRRPISRMNSTRIR